MRQRRWVHRLYADRTPARNVEGVLTFTAGLVVGLALGLLVIGFLAVGSYDRGRVEALAKRRAPTQAS